MHVLLKFTKFQFTGLCQFYSYILSFVKICNMSGCTFLSKIFIGEDTRKKFFFVQLKAGLSFSLPNQISQ